MAMFSVAVSTQHGSTIQVSKVPQGETMLSITLETYMKISSSDPFMHDKAWITIHGESTEDLRAFVKALQDALPAEEAIEESAESFEASAAHEARG